MSTLLLVMNPRRIPACIESIDALDIPKAWMQGYNEYELQDVIAGIVEQVEHDHYMILADDCTVTQEAVDEVLALHAAGHPVATGYCNLDSSTDLVNVQRTPLIDLVPRGASSYDFMTQGEVDAIDGPFQTYFAGMSLTSMSREMWLRFPFGVHGWPGSASDYHLCKRLQDSGVGIVSTRAARVEHDKDDWTHVDQRPYKRLLLGGKHRRVVWGAFDA